MEPEEIDKLFRDKLAGRAAVPSPDTWMRLQQKMEPPKKQRTMWVYYAAATVVLLLVSGILLLKDSGDATGPAVATAPRVAPPPSASPVETPRPSKPDTDREAEKLVLQAPVSSPALASTSKPKVRPSFRRAHPVAQPATGQPAETPVVAAAIKTTLVKSPSPEAAKPSPPALQPAALAHAAPDMRVVEVVVTRDDNPGPEEEMTLREQLNRKGHLLKNIYKQARNLKNGEPVELAAIGVDKNRIQEETKEFKQKLTNAISF